MLRILVIEDSPVNMALTAAILENAGHQVLQAEYAIDGIDIARIHQPDLVLMDMYLPDIDGINATRMLKADSRTAHIPVIAVTEPAQGRAAAQLGRRRHGEHTDQQATAAQRQRGHARRLPRPGGNWQTLYLLWFRNQADPPQGISHRAGRD